MKLYYSPFGTDIEIAPPTLDEECSLPTLSVREQEILVLVADGRSVTEIAQKLGLDARSAKNQTVKLYRKLGVIGAVGATRWAIRNGYLKP